MKVTRISIGRLINLGSYEHVRYEITVEVGESESASKALIGVEKVLAGINPKDPLDKDFSWHNIRVKHDHWTDQDWWKHEGKDRWEQAKAENDKAYADLMAQHTVWAEQQRRVRQLLDDLGAASEYKDAKLDWEQDT